MKEELAILKRLEEDCQSIQRSLAIIQSAQRILTFYTSDERQRLFKEYTRFTQRRRRIRDGETNHNNAQSVFRQDHPDIALICDALAKGASIDLSSLKLGF